MRLPALLNPSDDGEDSASSHQEEPPSPSSGGSLSEPSTPSSQTARSHRRATSSVSTVPLLSIKGPIRFPPFEDLDDVSVRLIQRFDVRPFGAIIENIKPISYNSDKRSLKGKTGLTKMQACEYTFKIQGKEWAVHWDCRVGLVRIAPFFRSLGYTKTVPGKMRESNKGLDEICHNVTGGAVHYQGYWMPYHCARELATTFCHRIAGALIPIFGPTFPQECIHPNAPGFGSMMISPNTINKAREEAYIFSQSRRHLNSPQQRSFTSHPGPRDMGSNAVVSRGQAERYARREYTPSEINIPQSSHPAMVNGLLETSYMLAPQPTPSWQRAEYPSPPQCLVPFTDDHLAAAYDPPRLPPPIPTYNAFEETPNRERQFFGTIPVEPVLQSIQYSSQQSSMEVKSPQTPNGHQEVQDTDDEQDAYEAAETLLRLRGQREK